MYGSVRGWCKPIIEIWQGDTFLLYFINGSLGTKEAQEIVKNVVTKVEEFKGRVIFTRDTHFENYLETQEGKKLPIEHCIKGTSGWEIIDKLEEIRKEKQLKTFNKRTFGSKELAEYLFTLNEKEEIEEIEFVGLCTDICVISNVLIAKTFLPEIKITVNSKYCAGVTKESHKNAIEAMKMCQVNIIE